MHPRMGLIAEAATAAIMTIGIFVALVFAGHAPASAATTSGRQAWAHTHKVRPGETSWLFWHCRRARPAQIDRLNPGRFPTAESRRHIDAGERLRLPPVPRTIKVFPGLLPKHGTRHARGAAALGRLAGCEDTTASAIRKRNGLRASDVAQLHVGQRLALRPAHAHTRPHGHATDRPTPSPSPTRTPTPTSTASPAWPMPGFTTGVLVGVFLTLAMVIALLRPMVVPLPVARPVTIGAPRAASRSTIRISTVVRAGVASAANVIGVMIALNGATEPTQGTRNPEIQQTLHLTDAKLALALGALSLGMFVTSTFSGRLADAWGTRKVLASGAVVCWGAFASVGLVLPHAVVPIAHTTFPLALMAVQFLVGAGFSLLDAAMYRISTSLESEGKKLTNQRSHAFNAIGSILGSGIGLLAVRYHISISWHLAMFGVTAIVIALWFAVRHLPDRKGLRGAQIAPEKRWEVRRAGIVAATAGFAVIVGYNWAAVLLERLGASPSTATVGIILFALGTAIGRLGVSRLAAERVRPVPIIRWGGLGAIVAIVLIALPGRVDAALIGFFVLGIALGPAIPMAQSAAANVAPGAEGTALVMTGRYCYCGFIVAYAAGPLSSLIGDRTDPVPLQIALGCLAIFPIAMIIFARAVAAARRQPGGAVG